MENPKTYGELKAHYLAVSKRLNGVTGGTGVVPIERVYRQSEQADHHVASTTFALETEMPHYKFIRMLRQVAASHNIDPALVMSNSMAKNVLSVRREVQWKARTELKMSYAKIGRIMKRDHTSVLSAVKKWQEMHPQACHASNP